jgi:hypothetical protein
MIQFALCALLPGVGGLIEFAMLILENLIP